MTQKKFVFAKKEIDSVRENEIGIAEGESSDFCSIFFIIRDESIVLSKNDFEFFDIKKTGDAFPKKVCNVCHRLLDTTKFAKNQNGKDNRTVRRPSCNDCRKTIDGVNSPLAEKKKWKNTKPEYEPFKCPICQKTTIPSLTSKVVLDHDHTNGKIRGWICDSCNTGIGRFKDDVSLLKRAIIFLETE
jgi:hypothetical protein